MKFRVIAGFVAAASLAASMAGAAPRHFTFAWAAHAPESVAMKGAEDFVAARLPAGLPMADAVARARNADARCRSGAGPDEPVTCTYEIASGAGGADLGEEVWVLSLTPDGKGALASAAVDRKRVGVPGDLDTKPTFSF